ncbi:hypothetical protein HanIR_Chr11g0515551 [Helianthus annuus]|nr:hypothetical protein HanIR_Chr11g0515551 [Helianthus annuus]
MFRRNGLLAQIRPNIDLFYIYSLYAKRQLSNPSALYLLHSTATCRLSLFLFEHHLQLILVQNLNTLG